MIKDKLSKLRQLKKEILYLYKKINSKQVFEYAKIQQKKLKNLKFEFKQVEQELHDLLDKETKQ